MLYDPYAALRIAPGSAQIVTHRIFNIKRFFDSNMTKKSNIIARF